MLHYGVTGQALSEADGVDAVPRTVEEACQLALWRSNGLLKFFRINSLVGHLVNHISLLTYRLFLCGLICLFGRLSPDHHLLPQLQLGSILPRQVVLFHGGEERLEGGLGRQRGDRFVLGFRFLLLLLLVEILSEGSLLGQLLTGHLQIDAETLRNGGSRQLFVNLGVGWWLLGDLCILSFWTGRT